MLDELTRLLLHGYSSADTRPVVRHRSFVASSRTVRVVEDYVRMQLDRPVCEAELCRHIGISVSSLHRAFRDVLALPPGVYLRRWRLTQVRRRLLDPLHAGSSVTEAALQFGFWQLGRLSQQFKQLFGELPANPRAQPTLADMGAEEEKRLLDTLSCSCVKSELKIC